MTVTETTEEIVITEQPSQKVQPPTAQIQAEEKKVDETITTTTQVEPQEQPTFQASQSVTHPEQPTQVISVVYMKIFHFHATMFSFFLGTSY